MTGSIPPEKSKPLDTTLAAAVVAAIAHDPDLREQLRQVILTGESDAWQGQRGSPLGPRRHRQVVSRYVAAGDQRARIVGRRYLLRRDLLEEELLARGRAQVARCEVRETEHDDLAAELGLESVG